MSTPILSRIDDAIADKARYSVVTRMELLGWSGHAADTRRETEALLAQLMEVGIHTRRILAASSDSCRETLPGLGSV